MPRSAEGLNEAPCDFLVQLEEPLSEQNAPRHSILWASNAACTHVGVLTA